MVSVFRNIGDFLNVCSHIFLMLRLLTAKNAQAVSLKTLDIYLLVYVTRYLDIFSYHFSTYNTSMKIFYISTSLSFSLLIRKNRSLRTTYEKNLDTFPCWKVCVLPWIFVLVMICISHELMVLLLPSMIHMDMKRVLWFFSILLEATALLPQLSLFIKYQEIECLTGASFVCKALYRSFYILNWIDRSYNEPHFQHFPLVYICGGIQSILGMILIKCVLKRGWKPWGLFSKSTYLRPRLSRRNETIADERENEIADIIDGIDMPLLQPIMQVV